MTFEKQSNKALKLIVFKFKIYKQYAKGKFNEDEVTRGNFKAKLSIVSRSSLTI